MWDIIHNSALFLWRSPFKMWSFFRGSIWIDSLFFFFLSVQLLTNFNWAQHCVHKLLLNDEMKVQSFTYILDNSRPNGSGTGNSCGLWVCACPCACDAFLAVNVRACAVTAHDFIKHFSYYYFYLLKDHVSPLFHLCGLYSGLELIVHSWSRDWRFPGYRYRETRSKPLYLRLSSIA